MPRLPPVTNATLPSTENRFFIADSWWRGLLAQRRFGRNVHERRQRSKRVVSFARAERLSWTRPSHAELSIYDNARELRALAARVAARRVRGDQRAVRCAAALGERRARPRLRSPRGDRTAVRGGGDRDLRAERAFATHALRRVARRSRRRSTTQRRTGHQRRQLHRLVLADG